MTTIQQLQADLDAATTAFNAAQAAAVLAQQAVYPAQEALEAASQALQSAMAEGLKAGTVGSVSSIDQALQAERFAGKSACIDFVKANPTCTEADAIAAWTTAGLAATGLAALIVPAESYAQLYRANLLKLGLVPDTTWESQRAWMVATDKAVIMSA
jgi:hypothetical protein